MVSLLKERKLQRIELIILLILSLFATAACSNAKQFSEVEEFSKISPDGTNGGSDTDTDGDDDDSDGDNDGDSDGDDDDDNTNPTPTPTPNATPTPTPTATPTPTPTATPTPTPSPTPAYEEACFEENFMQPKEAITKKVDILFVTDTSGSLDAERKDVAQGISGFIQGLGADVDYRVAVMFGHINSKYSGALYQYRNEALVLDSQKLSNAQVEAGLYAKLTNVKSEGVSDGGEAMLYSLNKSIQPQQYQKIQSQGFYRNDAALAIVFISDENDICAVYPNGVTPVRDGDGNEGPAYKKYCEGKLTPTSLYKQLELTAAKRPLVLSSVIYTDPNRVPKGGENEVGYGLLEITKLNNGKLIDMRDDNIAMGLKDLGTLTQTRLNLLTAFKLKYGLVVLKDTIKVYVDDLLVNSMFNEVTRTVQLNEDMAGKSESAVKINYCALVPKTSN